MIAFLSQLLSNLERNVLIYCFVLQVKKNTEAIGAVPEVAAWMAKYKK